MKRETVEIHGHPVSYRRAGQGPPIVLLHGITSSSRTWRSVMPQLAEHHDVIAPDLLGHGRSAKPRGDYSLGAYASGVRDLLAMLDVGRATVVGHSLGGGIALQFAYQFPNRLARLVLVDSGGLGDEVSVALRAATLPGSEVVIPLMFSDPLRAAGGAVASALRRIGLGVGADAQGLLEGMESLGDADSRRAFIHTARSVMDPRGQRVDARDRLYLARDVPSLVVWGERDSIIPMKHGLSAHELMPNSRFEVVPDAGHFPHNHDPDRFVALLSDFIATTEEAEMTEEAVRDLLRREER